MGFNYKAHGGLIGVPHKPSPHPSMQHGIYDTNTVMHIKQGFPKDVIQYAPFNDLPETSGEFAKTYISSAGGNTATLCGGSSYGCWERNAGYSYSMGKIAECGGGQSEMPPTTPVGHNSYYTTAQIQSNGELGASADGRSLHEHPWIALSNRYDGLYTNISWEFFYYIRGITDSGTMSSHDDYTFYDVNSSLNAIQIYAYVYQQNINAQEGPIVQSYYVSDDFTQNPRIQSLISHDEENVFHGSSDGPSYELATGQDRWYYVRLALDLQNRKAAIHNGRCTDDDGLALTTVPRIDYDTSWGAADKQFLDFGKQVVGQARFTNAYWQTGGAYRGGISELIIRVDDPDHTAKSDAANLTFPSTPLESTFT